MNIADFSFRNNNDTQDSKASKRGNSRGSSIGRQNAKARLAALKQSK